MSHWFQWGLSMNTFYCRSGLCKPQPRDWIGESLLLRERTLLFYIWAMFFFSLGRSAVGRLGNRWDCPVLLMPYLLGKEHGTDVELEDPVWMGDQLGFFFVCLFGVVVLFFWYTAVTNFSNGCFTSYLQLVKQRKPLFPTFQEVAKQSWSCCIYNSKTKRIPVSIMHCS